MFIVDDFFLIARDKQLNTFKVISLKEKWYLGKYGGNQMKRKVSLEAIDLVTTRFKSEEEMINHMYNNEYLDNKDVDLFIAKKIKRNNREYIKTHELIFNPDEKERISDLRKIAWGFLGGHKSDVRDLVDRVFNKLISKANSVEDFRNILACELTNVPKRLTDNFWKGTQSYSLKYQNLDSFQNYSAIRSIVEALNRYDYLLELGGNPFVRNIEYLNLNASYRKKIEPSLLKVLDDDYFEGQYNFLDADYSYKENEEKVLPFIPDISVEDKKKEIMRVFLNLPFGFLSFQDNRLFVNKNFFSGDVPINDFHNELLETLLPKYLAINLTTYLAHKNEYQKIVDYFGDTTLLSQEIRKDEESIYKCLNNKTVDKVFLWSLIYDSYLENLSSKKKKRF